jgi:hypothetical protein
MQQVLVQKLHCTAANSTTNADSEHTAYEQVRAEGSSAVKLVATQPIAAGQWIEIDYNTVSVGANEQVLNYGFVDLQGPKTMKCRFNLKALGKCSLTQRILFYEGYQQPD